MTRFDEDAGALALVQAIELEDEGRTVISAADRAQATRDALARARADSTPSERLFIRVLYLRAALLLDTVRRRAPAMAVIARRWAVFRWLLMLLPAAAFTVGFASDHVTDPHRLDLLSPSLLLVLLWNVVIYLYLAIGMLLPRRPMPALPGLLVDLWAWLMGRRTGMRMRVVARFASLWLAMQGRLFAARCTASMHLAAAAWAGGIGISLALRGVFVRYEAGWESTYLDAGQVHAILQGLFWPLKGIAGMEPFTLAEIAAMEDFSGVGQGGRHWVVMYCGLLLLVVVVPRLALAGHSLWRASTLRASLEPDLSAPYFQDLAAQLPREIKVGLHAAGPWQWQVLVRAWGEPGAASGSTLQLDSREGDLLMFLRAGDDGAGQVDMVLDVSPGAAQAPHMSWAGAPLVKQAWESFGRSWVLEPCVFDALRLQGPAACRPALERLRDAASARNLQRFDTAAELLGRHLRACLGEIDRRDFEIFYSQSRANLQHALAQLHGWQPAAVDSPAQATGDAGGGGGVMLWRSGGAVAAAGATAGAAAGALAGAKFGAALDIATGGATLGAGTLAGALGGAVAWVMQAWRKKGQKEEAERRIAEDALTNYLAIAHLGRDGEIDTMAASPAAQPVHGWRSEAIAEVAVHWPAFEAGLRTVPQAGTQDALADAFKAAAGHILRREFGLQTGIGTQSAA